MIASLTGQVRAIGKDALVVEVGGVGYRVFVGDGLLGGKVRVGQTIELYTQMWVRENDIALYGFRSAEELDLFSLLVTVSGVGPRTALAALSALSPESLRSAILREDLSVLTRIPGVGPKTARRLVLDLRDRLQWIGGPETGAVPQEQDVEVINALTSLGYSVAEATAALEAVPEDVHELDQRILAALRVLGSR
ncbi:MAG: Holliday junction branch migration protein RuvA [Chloroflexi bacterium]|nr:Holliday junction branch migration protein RuvA [Chloroflexota bacterium]